MAAFVIASRQQYDNKIRPLGECVDTNGMAVMF